MADEVKISALPVIVTPLMSDVDPTVNAGVTKQRTNQQLYTLFSPNLTGTITTSTTLSTPIPHTVFLAPVDGNQTLTLPALTAANGARVGDHIAIINNGNFQMALNYSNGSIIPGSVVNARQIRVYAIETLGTPGVLTVVERLGSIRDQDFDDVSLGGGAINNTTIGLLTPTEGKFTEATINGGSIKTTAFSKKSIPQATNARTLGLADAGGVIFCTENTGTTTITLPNNTSEPIAVGSEFYIENATGNQLVTIALEGGVTLNGFSPTVGDSGIFTLRKIDTNVFKCIYLYENTTTASTFAWGGATSGSVSISLLRINNEVTVELNAISVVSNQTSAMQSNTAIPARFRSVLAHTYQSDVILSGGGRILARYVIDTGGLIYFQASDGTAFGAATSILTEPAAYRYFAA